MIQTSKTLMRCLTAVALIGLTSPAFAQTPPMKSDGAMKSGGAMTSGAMASDKKMSKSDMAMMKKCQAMDHDKMMADAKCKAMMEAHPDMMKSDSMTKK
jgi:hypothetical protein